MKKEILEILERVYTASQKAHQMKAFIEIFKLLKKCLPWACYQMKRKALI